MGAGRFGSASEAGAHSLSHHPTLCGRDVVASGSRHPSSWFEYSGKQEASVFERVDFKRPLATTEKGVEEGGFPFFAPLALPLAVELIYPLADATQGLLRHPPKPHGPSNYPVLSFSGVIAGSAPLEKAGQNSSQKATAKLPL